MTLLVHRHGVIAGGGGGAAAPVDPGQIIGVTGSVVSTTGLYIEYVGAPLGAAFTGRIIYVVTTYFDGSSTQEAPTSVTIGGNAMTLLASVHKPSGNTSGISIWAYQDDGALGASATIYVDHTPTARNSMSIAVVAANAGDGNVIDSVGDADSFASVTAQDLTTAGSKCLLYVSHFQNGYEPTAPAPFTDGEYVYDENTTEYVCIAWDNDPSGSLESVDVPRAGSALRAAYLAVALD